MIFYIWGAKCYGRVSSSEDRGSGPESWVSYFLLFKYSLRNLGKLNVLPYEVENGKDWWHVKWANNYDRGVTHTRKIIIKTLSLGVGRYILIFSGLADRFHVIIALIVSEDSTDPQGFTTTFRMVSVFEEEEEEKREGFLKEDIFAGWCLSKTLRSSMSVMRMSEH